MGSEMCIRDRVLGNVIIVAGTLAASTGGTILAFGIDWGFSASLLVAAALIWTGFRVAVGTRHVAADREWESAPSVPRD